MTSELFHKLPLFGQFAIIFGFLVIFPYIAEKLRLPGIIGLIVGGILLGKDGLGVIHSEGKVVELFSDLGKLLLMFYAGYEINLQKLKEVGSRAVVFGLLTFSLPLAAGIIVGLSFGHSYLSSILIGTLLSSHTLLALPILKELNILNSSYVVITIGATIITDILSMLLLALCVTIHLTGFSPRVLAVNLAELIVYVPLVVFGFSAFASFIFRYFKLDDKMRFALMILMTTITALIAHFIELEGIVGAFLTGIAVRRAFPDEKGEDALSIVSHALFIPSFFLSVGLLVDFTVLKETVSSHSPFILSLVGGLMLSKFLAAHITAALCKFSNSARCLVWSLSLPQVAATLASALVAYNTINTNGERLVNESVLNGVIVLVVITAFLGPILTKYFGYKVLIDKE